MCPKFSAQNKVSRPVFFFFVLFSGRSLEELGQKRVF